jgi:hypothetical protein
MPTFTFTDGAATPLNDVRTFIGDTDSTDVLLYDETINRVIATQPVLTYAAAACCLMIAGKFARRVSKTVGATQVALQQQFEHYRELAKLLQQGGPGSLPGSDGSGVPTVVGYVSGVSIAEQRSMLDNTDLRPHAFQVGMDDFPGSARLNHDDSDTFNNGGGGTL